MGSAAMAAIGCCFADEATAQLRGGREVAETTLPDGHLDEHVDLPDETTGFDEPGPYLEVPDETDAEQPHPAKQGWDNATTLQPAAFHPWGRSFCESHHVGFFCDGFTRVKCCRKTWGFVKCGTTVHHKTCGWSGSSGGGAWPAPRESTFCTLHSVGYFCWQHHKVHCCKQQGHFVDCTTHNEANWRC